MALGFVAASNQYLNSGWTPLFATTDALTIAFWFNTTTGTNAVYYCGSDPVTGGERYIQVLTAGAPAGSKIRLLATDGSGGTTDKTGTTVVNDGVWHHFALVRDLSADKWYTYIDGTLDINVTDSCNASNTLNAMFFGCRNRNGSPSNYLDVTLDDIIAGQFTATLAQVQQLVASRRRIGAQLFGANLARWWPLQGVHGAVATGASSVSERMVGTGATPVNSPLYQGSPLAWRKKKSHLWVPGLAGWPQNRFGWNNNPFDRPWG